MRSVRKLRLVVEQQRRGHSLPLIPIENVSALHVDRTNTDDASLSYSDHYVHDEQAHDVQSVIEGDETLENELMRDGFWSCNESSAASTEDEDNDKFELHTFLQQWSVRHHVTHNAVRELLGGLHNFHPTLPLDPRTLRKTDTRYNVERRAGGDYIYLSVREGLMRMLSAVQLPDGCATVFIQINVDGLPVFNFGKKVVWPILARVVAPIITPIFMVAIWGGESKPSSFNDYLRPFVDEMSSGLKVSIGNQNVSISLHNVICDAPARASVKCVRGHNFRYGCDRCKQLGQHIRGRMTFPCVDAPLRSHEDFEQPIKEHGYRLAHCVLRDLGIHMINQFPYDYMHLVCLGVVKKTVGLWKRGERRLPSRLSPGQIQQLDDRIRSAHKSIPFEFQRKCRPISDCDTWKATEARQFLLYLGPVLLKGIISPAVYEHFLLLCLALRCFSSTDYVSDTEWFKFAKNQLGKYVSEFGVFYGAEHIVYNVHSLCHLHLDVEQYGAVDNYSSFPYESFLGKVKSVVRRRTKAIQQIVRRMSESAACSELIGAQTTVTPSASHEHDSGVGRHDGEHCRQFKCLVCNGQKIKICDGDNCFIIAGHVCVIRNIIATSDDLYDIVYSQFNSSDDFFTKPVRSSLVGIHRLQGLQAACRRTSVTELQTKCVLLSFENCYVAVEMLHKDN